MEGLIKIAGLKASINTGSISEEFPFEVIPVIRPKAVHRLIEDSYWLAGFIEAEGCFFVEISKSNTRKVGFQVRVRFHITQHSRDYLLMNSLVDYLNCGISRAVLNQSNYTFGVTKFSDIEDKIIPLLLNHPLQGTKLKDFEDFCKIVHMVKNKDHLNPDGFEKIKKIKSGMNTLRAAWY